MSQSGDRLKQLEEIEKVCIDLACKHQNFRAVI